MNFKITPARSAISDFLLRSSAPVDVEEIINYFKVKKLKTNKVTIYRNLNSLFKNGLIDRLEFGEGKYRYEFKKNHHHHLICTKCQSVAEVEGEAFQDMENRFYNDKQFLVKSHSLEFFGICKNCQS